MSDADPELRGGGCDGTPVSYPLSPQQRGMLLHSLEAPGTGVYVEQPNFLLRGRLDYDLFREAWQRVSRRRSSLRTSCTLGENGEPAQIVHPSIVVPVCLRDWRGKPVSGHPAAIAAFLEESRRRGFDFDGSPLFRVHLLRLEDELHLFVYSLHHVISDGWSVSLILRDVFTEYGQLACGVSGPPVPVVSYASYLAWLEERDWAATERYWRAVLAGYSETGIFPRRSGGSAEREPGCLTFSMDARAFAAVRRSAQRNRLTANTVVQAAWALTLVLQCGRTDVVFGAAMSGRPTGLDQVEHIDGPFTTVIPVRTRIDPGRQALSWLRDLQKRQTEAFTHSFPTISRIQRWSELAVGAELIESIVGFQNSPDTNALDTMMTRAVGSAGLRVENGTPYYSYTNYPVDLTLCPSDELAGCLLYSPDHLSQAEAVCIKDRFVTMLAAIAAQPERLVGDVLAIGSGLPGLEADGVGPPVTAGGGNGLAMSPDVQRTVLALTRAPAAPIEDTVPIEDTAASAGAGFIPVHGTFMALAGRQPGAIAVRAADRTLTFAQLAEESGRLASQLRAAGVGPEQVVAISSRRIASLIVALLAVWRAGAAFLLLDPREPSVRAVSQLSDCGATLLLTVGEGPHPATGFPGPVLAAENAMAAGQPGPEPGGPGPDIPSTRPGWLAYAVFTSGSTGRPKGVLIEHGGLACRARQVSDLYRPHRAPLAVAGAAPVTFDSFIDQTLPMLTLGHTLVLLDEEERLEPTSYLNGSSRARLDVVDVPPSQLTALVGGGLLTGARRPELVVFGGERPDDETWHAIRRSGTPAVSVYGASECTGASMHAEVAEHPEVTLGRPAWSARIYVVDVRLRLLPPGLAGEICIGGPGVGRGYACAPGQTAAAFVPDPFSTVPGARMYRTGDLGMLAPDGTVSFLGRTDDQLKIRGFRVEPGEVEALIAMMPGVRRAVVVPDRRDAGGIRGLLAFVESDGTGAAQPDRVAAALKASLPGYLRPSRVSVLDAFPLTRNGKIDRKGLAAIPAEPRRVPAVPASGLQRRLCDIWREVLGVPAVGPGDDFFELGGDSLLAFRVAARIQSALGKSVTVRAIFDERTPVALAAAIDASQEPAVSPAAGSRIPLTRRPAALLNKTGGTARHPSSSPSLANGVAKK